MTDRIRNWPELLLGLGIIFIGLVIVAEAATFRVAPVYARIGPAAFLWFSGGLLTLCGGFIAYRSFRNDRAEGGSFGGPAIILLGLAVSVFLYEPLGFIISSLVIFMTTAFGMGSRRWLRDVSWGTALAVTVYFGFTKGLGLKLPWGTLLNWGTLFT